MRQKSTPGDGIAHRFLSGLSHFGAKKLGFSCFPAALYDFCHRFAAAFPVQTAWQEWRLLYRTGPRS